MSKNTVSIIIPTKDRTEKLLRLITSIKQAKGIASEIIVVNDSPNLLKVPEQSISIINNHSNRGLAYARTAGVKKSKGEYILFIDDDNIVSSEMISTLAESLNTYKKLAAVGPLTYYASNKDKIWFLGSKLNLLTTIPTFYRSFAETVLINDELFKTENLHNCFMVRRELGEEVGWFDEEVFMNGTEFDLFQRIKEKHPNVFLATNVKAKCYHNVPEYAENFLRSLGFDNEKRVYYFQRNRGLHVGKYGKWYEKLSLFVLFYPLFFAAYSILFLLYGKFSYIGQHVKATVAGYKYLMRRY